MASHEYGSGRIEYLPVIVSLIVAFATYRVCIIIYNVHWHPLSQYPGPALRAASQIPDEISCLRGSQFLDLQALHERFGHVVRTGPNKLSYTDFRAWKDARQTEHARLRKAIAPAFNDSSLLRQEHLLQHHFDLLISNLHRAIDGEAKGRVDITAAFNFTAFDIIGDLVLGEPFGALESNKYPDYIKNIFEFVKTLGYVRLAAKYTAVTAIFLLLSKLRPSLVAKSKAHLKFVRDKVDKRLTTPSKRPDLIGHIQRNKADLEHDEIVENCRILLVAGSETTATHLSGVVYFLAKTPTQLRAAQAEVRSAFKSHEQITVHAVSSSEKLPYVNAVIQETFRCYPTVPSVLPRVTNSSGSIIVGEFVAGNTSVGVHPWSAYYHPDNFHAPGKFAPERWLPNAPIEFQHDKKDILQPFFPGPRSCLGKSLAYAEIRSILVRLLWHFDFQLEAESQNWLEDQKEYSLWDKGALWIKLERRKV